MKKRLLSFLLCMVLLIGLMPAEALTFSAAMPEIEKVQVYGFTQPAVGQTAGENLAWITVPVGAHYTLEDITWVDDDSGDELLPSDVFEAGGRYYLRFIMAPEDGYFFTADVAALIDGSAEQIDGSVTPEENGTVCFCTVIFTPVELCIVWLYLDAAASEPVSGAEVPRGEVFGEPGEPGREGETFFGWYTDRALTKPYDPAAPILEDTELFPRFVKDEDCCVVWIYLDADDPEPIAGVDVPRGDLYSVPDAPGREGEVFCGWYTDRALTQIYDPTAPITEDTELFARWEKQDQPDVCLGDVDGDGEVTILDATAIQRHLASVPTFAYNENTADTDGDDDVTILDATYIQRWLANLPTNDKIGKPI